MFVLGRVERGKKGEHAKVFEDAKRSGYVRVRVDGSIYDLSEEIKLEKNKKKTEKSSLLEFRSQLVELAVV